MHSFVQTRGRAILVAGCAVVWLALSGIALAGPQAPQGYAGEKTCLTCHEAQSKGYAGSAHARVYTANAPAASQGCESCHGPGQAHAEAGGDVTKIRTFGKGMKPHEISDACMTCHAKGEHALWDGSAHDTRNMSCLSCHSVHEAKSEKAQLKKTAETETCVQCHRSQVQKMNKTAHMPVREGKLQCGSCHNPHGSTNVKLLKAGNSVNQSCVTCHAEKRGPYLFDHPAVEESCTSCHDAHGSNNERMLSTRQPYICQRCHVTSNHPPTIYDRSLINASSRYASQNTNKITGRSCVVCHQTIHGSNHPGGKAFLR